MKDEALRELVREVIREELARYFRAGMAALEPESVQVGAEDTVEVEDALTLLEQHEDVMASWMNWASDEEDDDDWQDFDDD